MSSLPFDVTTASQEELLKFMLSGGTYVPKSQRSEPADDDDEKTDVKKAPSTAEYNGDLDEETALQSALIASKANEQQDKEEEVEKRLIQAAIQASLESDEEVKEEEKKLVERLAKYGLQLRPKKNASDDVGRARTDGNCWLDAIVDQMHPEYSQKERIKQANQLRRDLADAVEKNQYKLKDVIHAWGGEDVQGAKPDPNNRDLANIGRPGQWIGLEGLRLVAEYLGRFIQVWHSRDGFEVERTFPYNLAAPISQARIDVAKRQPDLILAHRLNNHFMSAEPILRGTAFKAPRRDEYKIYPWDVESRADTKKRERERRRARRDERKGQTGGGGKSRSSALGTALSGRGPRTSPGPRGAEVRREEMDVDLGLGLGLGLGPGLTAGASGKGAATSPVSGGGGKRKTAPGSPESQRAPVGNSFFGASLPRVRPRLALAPASPSAPASALASASKYDVNELKRQQFSLAEAQVYASADGTPPSTDLATLIARYQALQTGFEHAKWPREYGPEPFTAMVRLILQKVPDLSNEHWQLVLKALGGLFESCWRRAENEFIRVMRKVHYAAENQDEPSRGMHEMPKDMPEYLLSAVKRRMREEEDLEAAAFDKGMVDWADLKAKYYAFGRMVMDISSGISGVWKDLQDGLKHDQDLYSFLGPSKDPVPGGVLQALGKMESKAGADDVPNEFSDAMFVYVLSLLRFCWRLLISPTGLVPRFKEADDLVQFEQGPDVFYRKFSTQLLKGENLAVLLPRLVVPKEVYSVPLKGLPKELAAEVPKTKAPGMAFVSAFSDKLNFNFGRIQFQELLLKPAAAVPPSRTSSASTSRDYVKVRSAGEADSDEDREMVSIDND